MNMIESNIFSENRLTQIQLAFDSAAFLWLLRRGSLTQPDYNQADVYELDDRIESYLDMLTTYPDVAWSLSEESLQINQPGEIFVAGIIAFLSRDIKKVQKVTDVALQDHATLDALSYSLAWLPSSYTQSWIRKFLLSKNLDHKLLALLACEQKQEDPKELLRNILDREDCRLHERLYSQALKQAGELKRFDLLPLIRLGLNSAYVDCQYWARYALILMGELDYVKELRPWILKEGPTQATAILLAFRLLPLAEAKQWLLEILQDPSQMRLAIRACAILGDPQAVPWLIKTMQDARYAQLCAEAFSAITGVNLEEQGLILSDLPDLDQLLPDTEDEDSFSLDQDQYLPFPDASKIGAIWQKYQNRFKAQHRYFLGQPIDASFTFLESLEKIKSIASMRQCHRIAYEFALSSTSETLRLPNKIRLSCD